jgi:NTP pyrophosphatase (non-canonical NTP hydrolase)
MNTLNKIADVVHKNACAKGFHSEIETEDRFIERACNNLHDEISELHEAWRNGKLRYPCDKGIPLTCLDEELADLIIRTLDISKCLNVDIQRAVETKHKYNTTRAHRHGNKKS